MPVGVIVNVLSVVLGGALGSAFGDRLSDALKDNLTTTFGVCAMSMGIASVVLMKTMPAVVFSVIVGMLIGTLLDIDGRLRRGTGRLLTGLRLSGDIDMSLMLTAIVLFCASGTGIYGALVSGMTGDHSVLLAKSVLDLFTAMIFACRLKKAVALIGVPQLVVLLALFCSARLLMPLTSEAMVADFKACGGVILLATGLGIMRVKQIPIANLLPAMILVMPVSGFWQSVVAPLLG